MKRFFLAAIALAILASPAVAWPRYKPRPNEQAVKPRVVKILDVYRVDRTPPRTMRMPYDVPKAEAFPQPDYVPSPGAFGPNSFGGAVAPH